MADTRKEVAKEDGDLLSINSIKQICWEEEDRCAFIQAETTDGNWHRLHCEIWGDNPNQMREAMAGDIASAVLKKLSEELGAISIADIHEIEYNRITMAAALEARNHANAND